MKNFNSIPVKNKEFIYEYWGRTELGRKMIESENVSESDLLFLIPNNVKRMHGLPLTKIHGKKKRKRKIAKKRRILNFRLFDIICDYVDEILVSKFSDKEFLGEFVELKNLDVGENCTCFMKNIPWSDNDKYYFTNHANISTKKYVKYNFKIELYK